MDKSLFCKPDVESSKEVEQTRAQLLKGGNTTANASSSAPLGSSNWSQEEETEIAATINQFLEQTKKGTSDEEFKTFTFPTVRLHECIIMAINGSISHFFFTSIYMVAANGPPKTQTHSPCGHQVRIGSLVGGVQVGRQDSGDIQTAEK